MPQIGGMPPPIPRGRKAGHKREPYRDWSDAVELLRENPGENVLADSLTGVTNLRTLYGTVRMGGVQVLRELGGVVIPNRRSSDGLEVGDLWLRWEPNVNPATVYDEKFLRRDREREERNQIPV